MIAVASTTAVSVRRRLFGTGSPDGLVVAAMLLGAVIAALGNGRIALF